MARAAVVLQVYIFRDGEFLGTDVFTERRVVVGRDAQSAALVLESTNVSRAHAIIEHDGVTVTIRDNDSTNGVYVNEKKVAAGEVSRLDDVLIGDFSLKLKLVTKGAEGEAVAPTAVMPSYEEAKRLAAQKGDVTAVSATAQKAAAERPRRAEASSRPARVEAKREEPPRERPAPREPTPSRPSPLREAQLQAAAAAAEAEAEHTVIERAPEERPARRQPDERSVKKQPEERPAKRAAALAPERSHEPRQRSLAGLARPGRWVSADAEDDEDHDDDHRPSFSLVEQLARPTRVAEGAGLGVEILTLRGDSVTAATMLQPGQAFYIGHDVGMFRRVANLRQRMRLVRYQRAGDCVVEFPRAARGQIVRGKETVDLAKVARPGRKGCLVATLRRGEVLDLTDTPHRYYARWVQPPALPPDTRSWKQKLRLDPLIERSLGASFGVHAVVALLMTLLMAFQTVAPPAETETFAEVVLDKELKLEEPPPPPPPEPPKAAAPQPEPVARRMQAAPSKRPPKSGGTAKAPPGVLGLLSKTGSSAAPGPAAALAAVSNLSAANAPAGAQGFRVSGLIGKLPTNDISVGGGGGGVVTKGASALLRGGGGGGGRLSGKGERQVGGLVQKMPQAMKQQGGSLDRDAIQKVINENVSQIQRCYERELVRTPGLSGKVEVEWTIGTSGQVRSVRQKFTSLDSQAAVSCILDRIKGWRFPQPKGGEVVVSYPFIFKSIAY